MTKKETVDRFCREKRLIPHWYDLKKASRQKNLFFAYYGDEYDTEIYQFSYQEYQEYKRNLRIGELLGTDDLPSNTFVEEGDQAIKLITLEKSHG